MRRQAAQPDDGRQRDEPRRETSPAVEQRGRSHASDQQPFPAAVRVDEVACPHAAESAHHGSACEQESYLGEREAQIGRQVGEYGSQNALKPVLTSMTGSEQGEELPFFQGFVSFMAKSRFEIVMDNPSI